MLAKPFATYIRLPTIGSIEFFMLLELLWFYILSKGVLTIVFSSISSLYMFSRYVSSLISGRLTINFLDGFNQSACGFAYPCSSSNLYFSKISIANGFDGALPSFGPIGTFLFLFLASLSICMPSKNLPISAVFFFAAISFNSLFFLSSLII